MMVHKTWVSWRWCLMLRVNNYFCTVLDYVENVDLSKRDLTDLLISYTPSKSLCSSSKNLLKTPKYNLKPYGGRSFALVSAVLWNSLPQSLRDLQSVETFKPKLTCKEHSFMGLRGTLNLHCCCTFYELHLIFNRDIVKEFVIIISLL